MSEFITIKEASEYTGKAEITIRRHIDKLLKDEQINDNIDPKNDSIKILKDKNKLNRPLYRINKEYIVNYFKNIDNALTDEINVINEDINDNINKSFNTVISNLKQSVSDKESTINFLKNEINKKNDQMDQLIKQQEQSNIIIKSMQDKVFLLEHHKSEVTEQPVKQNKAISVTFVIIAIFLMIIFLSVIITYLLKLYR